MPSIQSEAFHKMNGELCSFFMRWKSDGDYLRCRKCKRPQITNYMDSEFPHASDCKARGKVEARPWRTLMEILRPLLAAAAPRMESPKAGPLAIGACITEGVLHQAVMRYNQDHTTTVLATSRMDVDILKQQDCIALMRPSPTGAGMALSSSDAPELREQFQHDYFEQILTDVEATATAHGHTGAHRCGFMAALRAIRSRLTPQPILKSARPARTEGAG